MIGDARFAAVACVVALSPVALNLAAGGLDYKPTASGDPCQSRTWAPTHSLDDVLSQAALSALDGAACKLNVPSETLGLALTSDCGAEPVSARQSPDQGRDRRRRAGRAQPSRGRR